MGEKGAGLPVLYLAQPRPPGTQWRTDQARSDADQRR